MVPCNLFIGRRRWCRLRVKWVQNLTILNSRDGLREKIAYRKCSSICDEDDDDERNVRPSLD